MAREEIEVVDESAGPVSSPTSSLHCYELDCAVKISSTCSNDQKRCIQTKNAVVTLGRNVRRQIILQVRLSKVKGITHVSYLLQHCTIHGKMIKKGCGSIEIPSKKIVIFLSNCAPRKLNIFLKTLDAKLVLLTNHYGTNGLRTPLSTIRNEMLIGLPNVFEKLSPLAVDEIRQLRMLRNKKTINILSPCTSKYSACTANDGTPKVAVKRRPLRDLQQTFGSDDIAFIQKENVKSCGSTVEFNDEQKAVIRAVIEKKKNVFFTGSAGSGKSFVLKRIIELLPAATTFVTASTGVAACFIGGITLHSFAGIGGGYGTTKEQCVELAMRKTIKLQWKRCQYLVIDEISMVDADYFEKLEYVARKVRNSDEAFGGIQLIITGDFLQLPPVTKGTETANFCFMTEAWARCIDETFLFRQVKRQTDSTFIEILQQIRVGRCSPNTVRLLTATRHRDFGNFGIVPTRLCTHTADVDLVNMNQLNSLEGDEKVFTARDSLPVGEKRKFMATKRLTLKIGAQVMLLKNLDLNRGLSNGSRGVVKAFSSRGFPIVRFLASGNDEIEITPVKFQFRLPEFETPFLRIQLPLQLAWAISIHKSQGLTLDAVEMSLSQVFADGQAYVALSRARSLNSIRLICFEPGCVRANSVVVKFYERLKERSTVTPFSRSRVALFHNNSHSVKF